MIWTPPPLEQFSKVALDTETTGLRPFHGDRPFALSVAVPEHESPGVNTWCLDLRDANQLLWVRDNLPKVRLGVWFNLKFDAHMLAKVGVRFDLSKHRDTATNAALIDEHLDNYTLDHIAETYLNVRKDTSLYQKLADLFGGKPDKSQMARISKAPWRIVDEYARQDALVTLALDDWQQPVLVKQELTRVAALEQALVPALIAMEERGVRVDLDGAEKGIVVCEKKVKELQGDLDSLAGFQVNVNSPGHIRRLLEPVAVTDEDGRLSHYVLAGDGTFVPKTEKGAPSLNKDVLMKSTHPCAKVISALKLYQKIKDTFLLGHVLGNHINGRVHPNYNSTRMSKGEESDYGTTSGRFSCNDPNIQQISKRNPEAGMMVRSLFLPDEGHQWITIDYSQMDFRVMTHFLRSPVIDKIYADDPEADFHTLVAEMTGLPRGAKPGVKGDAKSINLGLCFGMGKGKMAEQMGLPYEIKRRDDGSEYKLAGPDAEAVFEMYHTKVPGIKDMLNRMVNVAKTRGYVKTLMGRRCRFVNGEKTYKAGAMIFQGNAAEALKVKLVMVHRMFGDQARIMLNVHDEIGISLPGKNFPLASKILEEYIRFDGKDEFGLSFRTPIRGSIGLGDNWWQASSKEGDKNWEDATKGGASV